MSIIFQNYGTELEQIQQLYEKQKYYLPLSRNLPPVAGNIARSHHLLNRIEGPMKEFETHQGITKDAKHIIKINNKVARTVSAFEFLWYDQANVGLQGTLIIRHPDDGKLNVNFEQEILQLICEAKYLDRMDIDIPDGAKNALFMTVLWLTLFQ